MLSRKVYRHTSLRLMEIGDIVLYDGRRYVLRGLDPMSVNDRRAELEDETTGERLWAPLDEVEEASG
jgi:hypothetical protein